MWQMIRELVGSGTTVFLTTQDLDEAERLARDSSLRPQLLLEAMSAMPGRSGVPAQEVEQWAIDLVGVAQIGSVARPWDADEFFAVGKFLGKVFRPVHGDGRVLLAVEDDAGAVICGTRSQRSSRSMRARNGSRIASFGAARHLATQGEES